MMMISPIPALPHVSQTSAALHGTAMEEQVKPACSSYEGSAAARQGLVRLSQSNHESHESNAFHNIIFFTSIHTLRCDETERLRKVR